MNAVKSNVNYSNNKSKNQTKVTVSPGLTTTSKRSEFTANQSGNDKKIKK